MLCLTQWHPQSLKSPYTCSLITVSVSKFHRCLVLTTIVKEPPKAGAVQNMNLQGYSISNQTCKPMCQTDVSKGHNHDVRSISDFAQSFASNTISSELRKSGSDHEVAGDGTALSDEHGSMFTTIRSRSPKPMDELAGEQPPIRTQGRTAHRLVERHYRDGLNSRSDALRDAITGSSRLKATKAGVLAAAMSRIEQLEAMNAALQTQIQAFDQRAETSIDATGAHKIPADHRQLHQMCLPPWSYYVTHAVTNGFPNAVPIWHPQ